MKSKRTLRVGLSCAAVAMAVLAPATASSASPPAPATPDAPAQDGTYNGELEEANAWAIDALNLEAAWETTRGEGATVAVIDSGMSNHPYFEDKDVLEGFSTLGDEEDAWYDISPDDPAAPHQAEGITDKRGHGTAVTAMSLLAAPEATILPVRRSTGIDDGISNLALGAENQAHPIRLAVDNGADVIVMAWGICCGEADEDLHMAMQYAIDHDVVLVVAAGNEPEVSTSESAPAYLPGVVTVSGLGADGGPWEDSSVGPEVDVAGPADYTLTYPVPQSHPHMESMLDDCEWGCEHTGPPNLYKEAGGTSFAVGWIGGVIGLIRAAHPDLDANNAIQRLLETATDEGEPGRDELFGVGVPDAAAAVNTDVEPVDANPLGYPLAVPGASGEGATGEPAPGTGAVDGSASGTEDSESSDLVPFAVVVVVAAVLAGGASFLVLRRATRSQSRRGARSAPAGVPVATGVLMALIASTGAYLGAGAVIDKSEASSDGDEVDAQDGDPEAADASDDSAGEPEDLAADGNEPAVAAQAWQDAYTAGDLEAFTALTCENPWYRVRMNIMKLEDPGFERPGFAMLSEEHDDLDGDWQGESYRLMRQSENKAWVEAGGIDIGVGPTYEMALVLEDGEWKVCDFWYTSDGGWFGLSEWTERWPDDGDEAAPDREIDT